MKNKNLLIIAGIFLIAFAVIYDINIAYRKNNLLAEGISNSLIRFHVIGNSDSLKDQEVKVKVKDNIIEMMEDLLKDSRTIEESRTIILDNIDLINNKAKTTLLEEGIKDSVISLLTKKDFPLKQYGDIVLPQGEYEALVVMIGEGKGKNWWCVLFPPLCFVDATHGVIDSESKEGLKNVLTEEEYTSIILKKDNDVDIKVKSKIISWFLDK